MYTDDLTVIYLTANLHPQAFARYQQDVLKEAIKGFPVISVTRDENFRLYDNSNEIIWLDQQPKSHLNMYKQMLGAAKLAKTPYIAAAEDDVLYSRQHFTEFRPPLDTFAYDMNRWVVMTWQQAPLFSWKDRVSNCVGILPRELFIEAWEERLAKFPDDTMPIHRVSEVGRNNQEAWMGVTERKSVGYYASIPTIHVNHLAGTDSTGVNKRMGPIRATEIPHWGRAGEIVKRYV